MPRNFAFAVDMMLFSSNFAVTMSAFDEYVSPLYSIKFPPQSSKYGMDRLSGDDSLCRHGGIWIFAGGNREGVEKSDGIGAGTRGVGFGSAIEEPANLAEICFLHMGPLVPFRRCRNSRSLPVLVQRTAFRTWIGRGLYLWFLFGMGVCLLRHGGCNMWGVCTLESLVGLCVLLVFAAMTSFV